jgi:Flp pilus assembly protein TadB
MPLEKTPERSRRVAIGEFMLAVVLTVVGAVTGIWFAYIVAAAALLFAAFVWVRASREINGRGGSKRTPGS